MPSRLTPPMPPFPPSAQPEKRGALKNRRLWLTVGVLLPLLAGCGRGPGLTQDSPRASSSLETPADTAPPATINFAEQWVIDASEARSLLGQGATLLDARGPGLLNNPLGSNSLDGAIAVTWQQFSEPQLPHRGNLLQDQAALGKQLQAVGIVGDRPVIVFGNPSQGWGEEGRIVWMLRSLGHRQAVLVDGGYGALQAAGLAAGKALTRAPMPGSFVPQPQKTWQISQGALREALQETTATPSPKLVLIDTREPREFAGATPYGESRGGHLPGAVNLHFSQLLDERGYLLPEGERRDRLAALGITPGQAIVAYCTGGIRSGWLAVVLVDMGYDAKNYAGSMWEWSTGDPAEYPLEKSSLGKSSLEKS